MNTEPMNFDTITDIEVPVSIRGEKFVLCEAKAGDHIAFRNKLFEVTKPTADGRPTSFVGIADLGALLVEMCLFRLDATGKRRSVTADFILALPNEVLTALAKRAQEISKIQVQVDVEANGEEAKNSQGATTVGIV